MAAGDDGGPRRVWDAETGRVIRRLGGSCAYSRFVSFMERDRFVVSLQAEAQIAVHDWRANKRVASFDHKGNSLWVYEIGPIKTQHGINLHPEIHGDKIVVSHLHMNEGYVGAIRAKDGKPIWKTEFRIPHDEVELIANYSEQRAENCTNYAVRESFTDAGFSDLV